MTFTQRHFKELASKLRGARELVTQEFGEEEQRAALDALQLMEDRLIHFCAAESPTFDRARFIEAARLEKE